LKGISNSIELLKAGVWEHNPQLLNDLKLFNSSDLDSTCNMYPESVYEISGDGHTGTLQISASATPLV